MIKQAVILAAGNGSRIQRFEGDIPKPLRKVCGLTLIKRSILNAKLAGISEIIIVVGYKGDEIIASLTHDHTIGVKLQFVTNSEWQKSNGVSLLKVKPYVRGDFLLMMADHIFDRRAIEKMIAFPSHTEVTLGIDRNLKEIFDQDDATKVRVESEKIIEIGKEIKNFNAFDTGLFVCSRSLLDCLEKIYHQKNDASLTEGVRDLAASGNVNVCDISGYFWQDVDTKEALYHAENFLFHNLKKPTDGWIAQNINRKISLQITRLLVRTNLSANHVTALVTLIGVLSGLFVATGRYADIFIGAILFNLASILDGCDGEISKLKLSSSKMGEWLDTLSDNFTYLVFLIGIVIGLHKQGNSPHLFIEATLTFVGVFLTLGVMFFYLIRYTNSGSLVTIQKDLVEEENKRTEKGVSSWLSKIKFMMKRDFFALFFMMLAIFNHLDWILHLSLIGANLTWIVILAYKKEIFKVGATKSVEYQR